MLGLYQSDTVGLAGPIGLCHVHFQVNSRKIHDEPDVLEGLDCQKLFLAILGLEAALQVMQQQHSFLVAVAFPDSVCFHDVLTQHLVSSRRVIVWLLCMEMQDRRCNGVWHPFSARKPCSLGMSATNVSRLLLSLLCPLSHR